MPDSKYGRIFTESDVQKLLQLATGEEDFDLAGHLATADEMGISFKFPEDEPMFVLRARDKRALGAIRFYADHQNPRAPQNHIDGIDKALDAFEHYRHWQSNKMKDPD